MTQIALSEAQEKLPDLVAAVAGGEEVVITLDGAPVVKMSAIEPEKKPRPQFGSARGKIWMADDFDAPLDDFAEYM